MFASKFVSMLVKKISLSLLFLFTLSCNKNSHKINALADLCWSESKESILDIYLNLSNKTGLMRMTFMGQDIIYKIKINSIVGDVIEGITIFHSAASGEKTGRPASFRYNRAKKTYEELGLKYFCEIIVLEE